MKVIFSTSFCFRISTITIDELEKWLVNNSVQSLRYKWDRDRSETIIEIEVPTCSIKKLMQSFKEFLEKAYNHHISITLLAYRLDKSEVDKYKNIVLLEQI